MKSSIIKRIINEILDKNLYGSNFLFRSLPFLVIGLIIQFYAYYLHNPQLIIIYAPFYVAFIMLAGLFTKNFKREFHPNWWIACLLFYTSILSKAFAFVGSFENTTVGFLKWLLVISISEIALILSLMIIAVFGQRTSLRKSVGLDDNFFNREKNRWKKELYGFPNLDKILEAFDEGRFVTRVFDAGYFNLTILWSCNTMEKLIDTITDGIISGNSEKKVLFVNEKSDRISYPRQLKNLGYTPEENVGLNAEILWHKLRNKIAHHNYKPKFYETNEALKFLVSFIKQMPLILKRWNPS